MLWIAGGGGVFLIAIIGVVLVAKPFGKGKGAATAPTGRAFAGDATFDAPPSKALAELTVTFSDDPTRAGDRIKVTQAVFTLGRSATNDASFPNDHPVSRRHAQIEYKGGQFLLSELASESNGVMKPPTFGTYLNDEKLSGSPVRLKSGDEVRLGNRLKLRFAALAGPAAESGDEGDTIDELNDATID